MLEGLLRGPVDASPCDNVAQWWPRHRDICLANTDPLSRAIAGGFAADRVGWAFASGYQAALHALFPGALAIGDGLISETDALWKAAAPDPAVERWQRDRELLKVAAGIRARRAKRAWEYLRRPGPAG